MQNKVVLVYSQGQAKENNMIQTQFIFFFEIKSFFLQEVVTPMIDHKKYKTFRLIHKSLRKRCVD